MAEIYVKKPTAPGMYPFIFDFLGGYLLKRVCSRGRPLACSFRNYYYIFLVQNPYKPSCAPATGRRDNPLFNLTSGSPGLANLAQSRHEKFHQFFVEIDARFVCESLR